MVETIWDFNKSFLFSSVAVPAAQVVALVQKDKGVRIGQSSVISKNMHTFHPDTPEKINVLQGVDAGQAFYQRNEADTVYHIDVFHQCGKVDHHLVAANIKKAVDAYNLHYSVNRLSLNQLSRDAVDADYIDIQTSTGGGRITGSLIYGQKLSLRRAHENHVHIAAAFADEHVACLFYIALAVEDAILQSGLELRRNEQIIHINVSDKKVTNSSPYSDQSDSYIQDRKSGGTSVFLKRHQFTHDVVVLSDSFDTVQDVKEMMASIEEEDGAVKKIERKFNTNGNVEQMIKALAGIGIITVKNNKLKMTNYGREFKQYLDKNLINIQSQIRQMLKSLKPV